MAETPRDKRDDREFAQYQEIKKQLEEDRLDSAIRELKKYKRDLLANTHSQIGDVSKWIDNLNNQLKDMSEDDAQRTAVEQQLQQNKSRLKSLQASRKNIEEELIRANQSQIISEAEEQAAQADMIKEIQKRHRKIESLRRERNKTSDAAKREELDKQIAEAQKAAQDPELLNPDNYGKGGKRDLLQNIASVKHMPGWAGDVADVFNGKSQSIMGSELEKLGSKIEGPLGVLVNITGKIFDVAMAMRRSVDSWVDEAANVLAANVGRINAALEGSGQTYQSVTEKAVESLGLSRFVKQTDYISQIANLTSQGISYNVEQRALLETIKDKAITSFSSMDGNLLRLIRLKQQDLTATQFGLEAALRNTLNRVFKDSTYLRDMYDSISGAITDAVMISGGKDVTEYNSVVQTWMGAMYESGVNSSMITKLANAINNLGSGNVSALASDSDIQRLILLSMDTIGMDYADILQQGLSSSDINDLLSAVVEYLVKIESNTKDNNVLQSSYTNLFGMTMADLQAFKNLNSKMGQLTYVNQGSALSVVNNELAKIQSDERTVIAEQIQNVFDNARFTFGSSIAKDASSYLTWKVSNLMLDVVSQVVNSPIGKAPIIGTIAKGVGLMAEMAIFGNELKGVLQIARSLPSLFGTDATSLQSFINGAPSYGGDATSVSATLTSAGSRFKSVDTMSTIKANAEYQKAYAEYSSPDWDKTEEEADPILSKLEELDKMKTENEAGQQAWAVFLTGMTDDTLRSFASIFADENAMESTFAGENNVLKDNLFNYMDDTTSNSTTEGDSSAPTANTVTL